MPSLFFSSRLNLALQESNKYFYKVRIFPCQCTEDKHYQGIENMAGWTSSTLGSITFSNPDDDIFSQKPSVPVALFLAQLNVFMCNICILAQSGPRCSLTATHITVTSSHHSWYLSQSLHTPTCPAYPPNFSIAPTSRLQPTVLLWCDFLYRGCQGAPVRWPVCTEKIALFEIIIAYFSDPLSYAINNKYLN